MKRIYLFAITALMFIANIQMAFSQEEDYYLVGPQADGYLNEWLKLDKVDDENYQILLPVPNVQAEFSLANAGILYTTNFWDFNHIHVSSKHDVEQEAKNILEQLNNQYSKLSQTFSFGIISGTNIDKYKDKENRIKKTAFNEYKSDLLVPTKLNGANVSGYAKVTSNNSAYGSYGPYSDNTKGWSVLGNLLADFEPFTMNDIVIDESYYDIHILGRFYEYTIRLRDEAKDRLKAINDKLKNYVYGSFKLTLSPKSKTWSMDYQPDTRVAYMVATDSKLNDNDAWYQGYIFGSTGTERYPYGALVTYTFTGKAGADGKFGNTIQHNNVYCVKNDRDYLFLNFENNDFKTYKVEYQGEWLGTEHALVSAETAGTINFALSTGTYNNVTWNTNTKSVDFISVNSNGQKTATTSYSAIYAVPVGQANNPTVRAKSAVNPVSDKNGIKLECISSEKYQADITVKAGNVNNEFRNGMFYFQGFDDYGNALGQYAFVLNNSADVNTNPLPATPVSLKKANQGTYLNETNEGILNFTAKMGDLSTYTGKVRITFYVKPSDEKGETSYAYSIELLDKIDVAPTSDGYSIHKYYTNKDENGEVTDAVFMRTWCGAQNYQIPDGMKAYLASKFEVVDYSGPNSTPKAETTLSEVNYIPAKAGVVLYMDKSTINAAKVKLEAQLKKNPSDETLKNRIEHLDELMESVYDEDVTDEYFQFTSASKLDYKSIRSEDRERVASLNNLLVGNNTANYIYPATSEYFNNDPNLIMYRNFAMAQWSKCKSYKEGDADYVGFFRVAKGCKIGVNKAYLRVPIATVGEGEYVRVSSYSTESIDHSANAKGIMMIFDDLEEESETTAIQNVKTFSTTDDNYYTLSGVKVANPTSGIYIHKGKKIMIK